MKETFVEINSLPGGEFYYVRDGLEYGLVYKVSRLDIEQGSGNGEDICYQALESFYNSVPDGLTVKVHCKSSLSFSSDLQCHRRSMLADGYREIKNYISISVKPQFWDSFRKSLGQRHFIEKKLLKIIKSISFSLIEGAGCKVENINPELCDFFQSETDIMLNDNHLLVDNKYKSVLKLESLSGGDQLGEVYFSSLANTLKNLPLEYEFTSTFKKINSSVSEADLRVQTNKNQVPRNAGEYEKIKAKEEVLKQVELHGQSICLVDCVLVLESEILDELNSISDKIESTLKILGSFKRQLKTCLKPYLSSRVGALTGPMQRERGPVIPYFLPLVHFSSEVKVKGENISAFLREDMSPFLFDPSNSDYYARNGVIVGNSGMGKSVFLNVLIDGLARSENNYVILVDVKTSHTALAEKHGGVVHEIDTETSTGMSAFNLLEEFNEPGNIDKHVVEHIIDFIISLAEGSDRLKDNDRSKISNIVNEYISEPKRSHSLNDFIIYTQAMNLPNYENLKRWGVGGVYANVFSGGAVSDNRFQYFDLKSVDAAGKTHISRAVISSVMTQIYLLIRNKKASDKIFVIFDETPFFINGNFDSLAALSKNMRSMNGSTIFASQISKDLVGPKGEETLFNQSSFKILFSEDSIKNDFERRTGVSDNGYEFLLSKRNKLNEGGSRRFLLNDDLGEKIVSIRLTSEELARATTNPGDKEVILAIKELFSTDELRARDIMRYANEMV